MTRGCLVYTHPAAFGRPGHPVSLITTCPVTVGMSDAFAHDCHCPLSRFPPDATSRTARVPAGSAPQAARSSGRPRPADTPASTTTATIRRSIS